MKVQFVLTTSDKKLQMNLIDFLNNHPTVEDNSTVLQVKNIDEAGDSKEWSTLQIR